MLYVPRCRREGATRNAQRQGRLDQAAAGIEREFADDPQTRQQVLATLAEIYLYLSDFVGAESLLTRFQQLDDATTPPALRAQVHSDLADVLLRRGNPQQACAEVEKALALLRAEPAPAQRDRTALLVRGRVPRRGRRDDALPTTGASRSRARRDARAKRGGPQQSGCARCRGRPMPTTHLQAALASHERDGRGKASMRQRATIRGRRRCWATCSCEGWRKRALGVRAPPGRGCGLGALL